MLRWRWGRLVLGQGTPYRRLSRRLSPGRDYVLRFRQPGQRVAASLVVDLAIGSQAQATGSPVEQAHAQPLLKLQHPATDGRFGEA